MARLRSFTRQLVCPDCGDVIGDATLRPLTGWLTIKRPDGGLIGPSEGAVQLRVAEQRRHAAPADEQAQAERQLEYVRRNIIEQIYDLGCPHGHRMFVTSAQIAHAMRQAQGGSARLPRTG